MYLRQRISRNVVSNIPQTTDLSKRRIKCTSDNGSLETSYQIYLRQRISRNVISNVPQTTDLSKRRIKFTSDNGSL
jgi:hypothetical protein